MNGSAEVALIGVGVGAALGFLSAQVGEGLRRKRKGLAAARLVWTELRRNEGLADDARKFGPRPLLRPRLAFWQAHAATLAEVVHPNVLIDLEIAYGAVEALDTMIESGETGDTATLTTLRRCMTDGTTAVEPYARQRPPLLRTVVAEVSRRWTASRYVSRLNRGSVPPVHDHGAASDDPAD